MRHDLLPRRLRALPDELARRRPAGGPACARRIENAPGPAGRMNPGKVPGS